MLWSKLTDLVDSGKNSLNEQRTNAGGREEAHVRRPPRSRTRGVLGQEDRGSHRRCAPARLGCPPGLPSLFGARGGRDRSCRITEERYGGGNRRRDRSCPRRGRNNRRGGQRC